MTDFAGFPVAALDFYDDLEVDNTKSYWEKHKQTYAESVKAPMTALCAALGPEFGGSAKVFRPYRDVRFAKDKTPYKTHQGAFVAAGPATGWYVEISARGVRIGAGFYEASCRAAGRRPRRHRPTTGPARSSRRSWAPSRRDGCRDRRRAAQDQPARVRRRPPADRAAPAQVADRRPLATASSRSSTPRSCSTWSATTGGHCARSSSGWPRNAGGLRVTPCGRCAIARSGSQYAFIDATRPSSCDGVDHDQVGVDPGRRRGTSW